MSVFYSLEGSATLQTGAEVDQAVSGLRSLLGSEFEVDVSDDDDGMLVVITGGTHVSYDGITRIDEAIRDLSRFAVESGGFATSRGEDGDDDFLYVGPPEKEGEARSYRMVLEITGLDLDELTQDHRGSLALLFASELDPEHRGALLASLTSG